MPSGLVGVEVLDFISVMFSHRTIFP